MHTTWQARGALELHEERSAQQRQQEKKNEEQKAAERLKRSRYRAGTSPQRGNASDPRGNNSTKEHRAHNAPLLQHRSPQRESSQHAGGQESEQAINHHEGIGDLCEEMAGGAGGDELEGSGGAPGQRGGGSGVRDSNDVAFVLRKLYTGGGLDAQQQGWKCMPTNLFNTLTLQLGTLSKVGFSSKMCPPQMSNHNFVSTYQRVASGSRRRGYTASAV